MVPRGLEPRTLRLLAVRSNQLSYETCDISGQVLGLECSAIVGSPASEPHRNSRRGSNPGAAPLAARRPRVFESRRRGSNPGAAVRLPVPPRPPPAARRGSNPGAMCMC